MAERLDITTQEYRDYPAVSNSMLSDYKYSPGYYYGRHVTKDIGPPEESKSMRLGTLAHMCILEPNKFALTVSAPKVDRRTKAGKAEIAAWEADQHPEAIIVDYWEKHVAQKMANCVRKNPVAKKLLAQGVAESAITWECSETGLDLKALVDFWTDDNQVLDLKFLMDPKPSWWYTYTARDRGYHRQAAHYIDGVSRFGFTEKNAIPFTFICCGNDEPHDVYCIRMDQELIETASMSLTLLKLRLKYSLDSGDWMPPESRILHTPEKPIWGHDEDEENGRVAKFLGYRG